MVTSKRTHHASSRRFVPALEVLEGRTLPSTFTVLNLADSGDGSLRAAVLAANANPGPDVIDFDNGLFANGMATIQLTGGEIDINGGDIENDSALTITGPGADKLTIDAQHSSGIFAIFAGFSILSGLSIPVDATISGLTLTGGSAGAISNSETVTLANVVITGNSTSYGGGGIRNTAGIMTVIDSTVSDNSVFGLIGGGGILNEGGILTVTRCTLSDNTAVVVASGGGIFNNSGILTVTDSILSHNSAGQAGGGIANGNGIPNAPGSVTVTNSTLSGNSAVHAGGGIFNDNGTPNDPNNVTVTDSTLSGNSAFQGGGILNGSGTMTVTSSTLSGNSSTGDPFDVNGAGGGIFNGSGTMTVTGSTLSGNSAVLGGGVFNDTGAVTITSSTLSDNVFVTIFRKSGTLTLNNTILAGGDSSVQIAAPGGTLTGSHNLIEGQSPAGLTDTITAAPLLGPLQDNGGPTRTRALLPGSPAIDAGSTALVPPGLATDQRGPGFARIVGGAVDLGAFEDQTDQPIALSGRTVAENLPAGTFVGSFSRLDPDPDGPFAHALVPGAGGMDNASFAVDASGNLVTAATFDFETQHLCFIRVQSTDAAGLSVKKVFGISVTNVNEAPTDIALDRSSVAEPAQQHHRWRPQNHRPGLPGQFHLLPGQRRGR
jgi:hypothetical protein